MTDAVLASATPPSATPLLTQVIMNKSLTAALFQTYARLFTVAWSHQYQHTDWLTMQDLASMLGKVGVHGDESVDRATIFRRLAALKELGLIKWEPNQSRMRVHFLDVPVAKSHECDPSSSSSINSNSSDNMDILLLESQKCDKPVTGEGAAAGAASGAGAAGCAGAAAVDDVIDHAAWDELGKVGFGEPAKTQLSNMPHVDAHYVKAMAAQFFSEGMSRRDLGALRYRIMNKWPAPHYCETCGGLSGAHASSCSTVEGESQRKDSERRAEAVRQRVIAAKQKPVQSDQEKIWGQVLSTLALQVTNATYDTWLRRTRLLGIDDWVDPKIFTVGCHNEFCRDWLANRMAPMIKRAVISVVGGSVELRFDVMEMVNGVPAAQG